MDFRNSNFARITWKFDKDGYEEFMADPSNSTRRLVKFSDFKIRPVFRDIDQLSGFTQDSVPPELRHYFELVGPIQDQNIEELTSDFLDRMSSFNVRAGSVYLESTPKIKPYEAGDSSDGPCDGFAEPTGVTCSCQGDNPPGFVVPSNMDTPDLRKFQAFLKRVDRGGLGFEVFDHYRGGQGAGAQIFVMDRGYGNHEMLTKVSDYPTPRTRVWPIHEAHGTAVLGILAGGGALSSGIIGTTSLADVGFIQTSLYGLVNWESAILWLSRRKKSTQQDESSPDTVLCIPDHIQLLNQGTLEGKTCHTPHLPLESIPTVSIAIKTALNAGIVVVLAAGNGGIDLDRLPGPFGLSETGALMVGGICPTCRQRVASCNAGSRVDLNSWGSHITTCGAAFAHYRNLVSSADSRRCYTSSFGDTSGACTLVAGLAACMIGLLKDADYSKWDIGTIKRALTAEPDLPNLSSGVEYLQSHDFLPKDWPR